MLAASLACAAAVLAVSGGRAPVAVLAGMAAPLAAALVSWVLVRRTHERAPARVSGLLVKLFAVKLVLFGGYFVAVVPPLREDIEVLVGCFTAEYVLLHVIEALYLRRLFVGTAGRPV